MTIKEILERNVKAHHRLGMITKDLYETLNDGHPHTLRKSMLEEMINASLELLTQAQDLHAHMAQQLAESEVVKESPKAKPVAKKTAVRKTAAKKEDSKTTDVVEEVKAETAEEEPVKKRLVKKPATRKASAKKVAVKKAEAVEEVKSEAQASEAPAKKPSSRKTSAKKVATKNIAEKK